MDDSAATNGMLNSQNLAYVEQLYAAFLRDPASVPDDWRRYFTGMATHDAFVENPKLTPTFRRHSVFSPPGCDGRHVTDCGKVAEAAVRQERVDKLVRAYRVRGHMVAQIDPLGIPRPPMPELDPAYYGFTEADLDRRVAQTTVHYRGHPTLRQLIEHLRATYCRSIGVQFMHMDDLQVRTWLQERMEPTENRTDLTVAEQIRILTRLTDAVIFEEFIQRKYLGAKTFSLEGAESLIPLLDLLIEKAGEQGLEQIVIGMAHRGRLNVLANIMGKSAKEIFLEFEDPDPELHIGRGDVKYHLGYARSWTTSTGNTVRLSLCFNPSHLEFVNPVALGRMRANQDRAGDLKRERGMCVLIHGEAAFAGEGIVQETLNLSRLPGYTTGGSLHIIVNNQIGFTTPPSEGRSTTYASDVARMLQAPVFHVNGEDPEAVAQVVRLAMEYRAEFRSDVVIDMYCYRRRGHNEGDEPMFTQPLLYQAIEKRKSVREGYLEHLLKLGGITREQADEIAVRRREHLERELAAARSEVYDAMRPRSFLEELWSEYQGGPEHLVKEVPTGVPRERLAALLESLARLPEGFHPHPTVARHLEHRRQMARGERPLDWAAGEALAFATLATEGTRVRLSGQDSCRGTFSHRHAVIYDMTDGRPYTPLQHLDPQQVPVEIFNSPLSEAGVLGFEYGYSLDYPDALVLWEAQFGDFANAAQVIIDEFVTSAEGKWNYLSGLVLLLPHGYEGQGPEHSSARLERYLELAAEDNIQVVVPSTPAQMFHVLRRQVLRQWRKPLVVITPKSLLRHPRAVSSLDELATGTFQRILPDTQIHNGAVRRVLLCTGKIYYELLEGRERLERYDVAIVRLEQLYPLPEEVLSAGLARYADGTPVFWVQEEPENMGAWRYLRVRFGRRLIGRLPFSGIYRPASASTATGSASSHKMEQRQLIDRAFGDGIEED